MLDGWMRGMLKYRVISLSTFLYPPPPPFSKEGIIVYERASPSSNVKYTVK